MPSFPAFNLVVTFSSRYCESSGELSSIRTCAISNIFANINLFCVAADPRCRHTYKICHGHPQAVGEGKKIEDKIAQRMFQEALPSLSKKR